MRWANLPTMTLVDYPGLVSGALFAIGCNFRCPFCHNPELALPGRLQRLATFDSNAVLTYLAGRRGFLDGVVLTGGEPTLRPDLVPFARRLRDLGYRVKLDTNGSRPEVLERLFDLELVDYVAVDIKGPRATYGTFAGIAVDVERVERSVTLVRRRAPDYEFRTTVAPGLTSEHLHTISDWIDGARRYSLQRFQIPREKDLLDPACASLVTLTAEEIRSVWELLRHRFQDGGVRG